MITKSKQETISLGKKIAATFKGGDIVLLEGNLGAGKTTLTKGIAQYFGIEKVINSPTFTLINIHPITSSLHHHITTLVHIDTYRLENEKDLLEIGVEDYLGASDTVCIIEWPEKIKKLLKNKKVTSIKIEHQSDNERNITIKSYMISSY